MLKPVKLRWTGIALVLGLALMTTTGAEAAQHKHKRKPKMKPAAAKAKPWSGAENSLIGVKLYDSGQKVIELYGTPDDIEALSFTGTSSAAGGAGGPGAGGPGGPGAGRGAPGGMAPGASGPGGGGPGGRRPGMKPGIGGGISFPTDDTNPSDPFNFGDTVLMQKGGGMMPGPGGASPGGPGGMAPGAGAPGAGGPGGGGAGVPQGGGGAADRVTFTRWIYTRSGAKYAFIVDKFGHVVQIEAIGIDDSRVKTKRGIGFGATFAQVFTTYKQPDGYEIGGENVMVKYLVHDNVAFRLSRLGTKKPQVVTGIVVAAGKS